MGEVLLGGGEHLGTGGHTALGQFNEARAGLGEQRDTGHGLQSIGIRARLDSALSGDQADAAIASDTGGGTRGRVDDLDDGDALVLGIAAARVVQDGRGGGVAGDDQHLDAGLDELVHDAQRQGADLIDGLGTVGSVGRVPDVEDLLAGQLVEHGSRDCQAPDPGVEHPDRRVIHASETRRGLSRKAARLPVIPATR